MCRKLSAVHHGTPALFFSMCELRQIFLICRKRQSRQKWGLVVKWQPTCGSSWKKRRDRVRYSNDSRIFYCIYFVCRLVSCMYFKYPSQMKLIEVYPSIAFFIFKNVINDWKIKKKIKNKKKNNKIKNDWKLKKKNVGVDGNNCSLM